MSTSLILLMLAGLLLLLSISREYNLEVDLLDAAIDDSSEILAFHVLGLATTFLVLCSSAATPLIVPLSLSLLEVVGVIFLGVWLATLELWVLLNKSLMDFVTEFSHLR